jgi:DNA polymerase III epsilon subunit family exonuclease
MHLKEIPFVCVDLETTGLSLETSKIVEIGAVKFYPWERDIDTFECLVNPKINIPEEVIRIHGITDYMVRKSPYIEDVLPDFLNFIGDCPLIAHNADFDFAFLSKCCTENNTEAPSNAIFDTLRIAQKSVPIRHHNLSSLYYFFGLIVEGKRHRGLTDAIIAARVFELCVDRLGINTYDELAASHPDIKFRDYVNTKVNTLF